MMRVYLESVRLIYLIVYISIYLFDYFSKASLHEEMGSPMKSSEAKYSIPFAYPLTIHPFIYLSPCLYLSIHPLLQGFVA